MFASRGLRSWSCRRRSPPPGSKRPGSSWWTNDSFPGMPSMMHAKTIVADGIWSSIGSMNFDNRSLAFNNESNLVVWDRPFGALMDSTFFDDLRFSHEIHLATFRHRPLTARMVEMGASVLSRLL